MMEPRSRIVILNPNTNSNTTAMMSKIAGDGLPDGTEITGMTAPFGSPLIFDAAALALAARAVVSLVPDLLALHCGGVVVAAFGDPGLTELQTRLPCKVVGLAQASMASAAKRGERFCVVTTTPGLVASINATARAYGHEALFSGTFCTNGDPQTLMRDPLRLTEALYATCERVAATEGVEAIIIGGGPLALSARLIRDRLPVRLVEPLREAIADLIQI